MNWQRFLAILVARNREFIRDRGTLAWNILFPIVIVTGFAFAFSEKPLDQFKVGILPGEQPQTLAFLETKYIQFIALSHDLAALKKVERHQLDMLVDIDRKRFWINDASAKGYLLEKLLQAAGGDQYEKQAVSGDEIRYVDWLIPGILGMNIMFSALFGIGYVIVRYRNNGVLKRLKATPLTAMEFLAAQVVSRLWIIVTVTSFVYLGTHYFIGFRMVGNYLDLFLVLLLGAMCLISMGLVIAARMRSEEMASGLLNLLALPMMFLSGVWFSLEGLHPWVQKLAQAFPLTHVINAARQIMIDGASLGSLSFSIIVLILMSLCFLLLGAYSFRWE